MYTPLGVCISHAPFFFHTSTFQLLDKPSSQVSSLLSPGSCLRFFIAHRVQQSHCLSSFHRMLLTHALALSASQFVHKKTSLRNNTSMHSAGLELTKLTYTRLEDDLIRHRGDRLPLLNTRRTALVNIPTYLVPGPNSTSSTSANLARKSYEVGSGCAYKSQYFGSGCMAYIHHMYLVYQFFRYC